MKIDRCSGNCFPMRDFAEIWGNTSDHDTNNLLFESRQIRLGVFELADFAQNWREPWKKPTTPAQLFWPRSPLIKWLLNESRPLFLQKYWFFLTPSPPIKSIQFFDPHEDVRFVRPRFPRENWTLVNNPRSQPFKVLFQLRISQIWPAQSSHGPFNEIWFGGLSERTMIIRMIPGQISGDQRAIRSSLEPFSGL
jgi:hypothetical protein